MISVGRRRKEDSDLLWRAAALSSDLGEAAAEEASCGQVRKGGELVEEEKTFASACQRQLTFGLVCASSWATGVAVASLGVAIALRTNWDPTGGCPPLVLAQCECYVHC
jgi:hypothetical protein